MTKPIKDIVIIGGGTAGWMAAAAFSRLLNPKHIRVRLIESDKIGTVGVGEATIPNIASFNSILGINEAEFLAKTNGTFKLGIEFVDWGKKGDAYLHPFGHHGVDMNGIDFHQYWLHTKANGNKIPIQEYSLSAVAAKNDKFTHPSRDQRSVLSQLAYAYHFDATLYAKFLREYAEKRGVIRTEGKVVEVGQNNENGFITHVSLENGEKIEGDFFFDCSGFRALLIEKTLGTSYEDWSHWLPCNAAQAVACERNGPLLPYTRATAQDAGWQWRIPTQHRTGNGYVYCNNYISDDEAAAKLLENLDGKALGDPRQIRFTTGRRKQYWTKNCIALGLSGGFLEPLESTSIYLIQAGITRFISLFPDATIPDVDRDEYNRLMDLEYEQVRDFIILHYIATKRDDTEFWNYCRTMEIPEALQRKVDLFRNRGRFFRYEGELFTKPSWIAVLLGQNIIPKHYDPIVATLDAREVQESLISMQKAMNQATQQMPSHQEFIDKYCPTTKIL